MLTALSPVAPAAASLPARRHLPSEVDLCWIAGQLGMLHRPRRAIIDKLRLLCQDAGFPLPKNPRFVKGVRQVGAASIDTHSIWDRDAVERWLEDDRPPAESAALVELRRSSVAEEMRGRALQLVAA